MFWYPSHFQKSITSIPILAIQNPCTVYVKHARVQLFKLLQFGINNQSSNKPTPQIHGALAVKLGIGWNTHSHTTYNLDRNESRTLGLVFRVFCQRREASMSPIVWTGVVVCCTSRHGRVWTMSQSCNCPSLRWRNTMPFVRSTRHNLIICHFGSSGVALSSLSLSL